MTTTESKFWGVQCNWYTSGNRQCAK